MGGAGMCVTSELPKKLDGEGKAERKAEMS